MSYFRDAEVLHEGHVFRLTAAEGEALEGGANYWHGPGDPSSWLAVAAFRAARSRVGDASQEVALELAARALEVPVDRLRATLDWHEAYMRWHDGDPDYAVMEAASERPADPVLPGILAILTTTVGRWRDLVRAAPLPLLERAPAAGEWSAADCLRHVLDVEMVLQTRLAAFMEGRDFPGFDPDSQGAQAADAPPPAELASRLGRLRELSLAALGRVTPDDLERVVRHQELGPVRLAEMAHEWAAHDLSHLIQAERALMQPFIDGCGPWQPFFAADRIGGG